MDKSMYEAHYQMEENHWWFGGRREILLDRIKCLSQIHKFNHILDAGCGTGLMVQHLKQFGDVYGFDPDPDAVAYSNEREKKANHQNVATIKHGLLPNDIPFRDVGFDLITLLDVLEHIDDDLAVLKSLHSLLNREGILLVTVPAYQFLWSGHDTINQHKRRYDRTALRLRLAQAGFHILKLSYFNTLLFLPIAVTRLLSRWHRGVQAHSDLSLPSPTVNRLLMHIFILEKTLLHPISLPFGVSLLAVVQRRE